MLEIKCRGQARYSSLLWGPRWWQQTQICMYVCREQLLRWDNWGLKEQLLNHKQERGWTEKAGKPRWGAMGAGRELYELSWPEDLVSTIIYIPLHLVSWGALFGCFGLPTCQITTQCSWLHCPIFCLPSPQTPGLLGHYIVIKGSIQEEDRYNNPKYASNTVAPKYIKQLLMGMKGEIHKKIILGDFNTSLTSMDRSSRQNKEIMVLIMSH